MHFLSAPPGCMQRMGWLSPQLGLHWPRPKPICAITGVGYLAPMQPQLCPGLSPGGWLGSQTRHSLRSLSLRCLSSCQPVTDLNFRSPWSARIPALPRERGEVNQPGCRCYVPKRFFTTAASVVLALRLGFSLNQHKVVISYYPKFCVNNHATQSSIRQLSKVAFLEIKKATRGRLIHKWNIR